jgi:hypothetical protein
VPEALKAQIARRAAATGHTTVDQYIAHLIRADADGQHYPATPGRSFTSDAQLVNELRKGIASGHPVPMTDAEWETLRGKHAVRRSP